MSDVGVAQVPARTLTSPDQSVPPFGIYRLSILEWQIYAYQSLRGAERAARNYLYRAQASSRLVDTFELNTTYALTYVERRGMDRRRGLEHIRLETVIERIGNLASNKQVEAVPIGALTWKGRHIIAPFNQDSVEYKQLLEQRAVVAQILGEAGMSNPPVYRPHHTSLSGFLFEGYELHKSLNNGQRTSLLRMMSTWLTAAGIDSVELGETIVGRGYLNPFTPDNLQADESPVDSNEWLLDCAS